MAVVGSGTTDVGNKTAASKPGRPIVERLAGSDGSSGSRIDEQNPLKTERVRIVVQCRSSAAIAATYRRRKNSCWWVAATPRPGLNHGSARAPLRRSGRDASFRFRSLNELAAFLNRGVAGSPGHDRHRGRRILRRPVNQLVRIDHINQDVPLGVAAADDLHLLEEER